MMRDPSTRTVIAVAVTAVVLAAAIQIFDGNRRGGDDAAQVPRAAVDASSVAVAAGPAERIVDAGDGGDADAALVVDAGPQDASEALDPLVETELDPRCAAVTSVNDDRLRLLAGLEKSCATAAMSARHAWHVCEPDEAGAAWALAITSATCTEDATVRVTFAIAHVARPGGVAVASPSFADALGSDPQAPREGGPAAFDIGAEGTGAEIALDAPFDIDGDGAREALLTITRRTAGAAVSSASVWTFHRGAIAPYGERRLPAIVAFDDIDEDGRRDIVTRSPYDAPFGAWLGAQTAPEDGAYPPAVFAAHALEDGGFTDHDAIARSYVKRACRARPKPLARADRADTAPHSSDAIARQVICARVWGATEAEAIAIVKAACPASDAGGEPNARDHASCARDVADIARVKPPVHLP